MRVLVQLLALMVALVHTAQARSDLADALSNAISMRLTRMRRWLQGIRDTAAHYARQRPLRALSVVSLLVILLASCLGGTVTLLPRLAGAQTSHTPNTLARFRSTGNAWQRGREPFATVPPRGILAHNGLPPDNAPPSSGTPQTHPIRIALDAQHLYDGTQPPGSPDTATRVKSSEGVLELGLPDHAIDIRGASVPGAGLLGTPLPASQDGPLTLELKPTQGTFHAETIRLAGFALHVVDAQGREASGVTLRAPMRLVFHYQPTELAGLNAASLQLVWPATADQAHHRPAVSVPVTVDPKAGTLSATVDTLSSGTMALTATSSDANTASSEHVQLTGNSGDATFTVPFDLPPAAGGLAPALQLVYSSAGPNGRHSRQASAPWVGDGWDLSLGSISYDASTSLYYLNGVGGDSEVLLCCRNTNSNGINYFVPHHHPAIRVFASDNSINPSQTGASFIVRTPDGLEYDLGASSNSIRSTVTNGVKTYLEWDTTTVKRLDDTGSGSAGTLQEYTVKYWQDWSSSGGISYTRDAGLREVDYNYAGGSPLARVYFNVHWPGGSTTAAAPDSPATAISYGTNYNCSGTPVQATTLRCDDPTQPSGWAAVPLNFSTLTLDGAVVQVQSGGTWHTVRTYQLSYAADSASYTCWTVSGSNIACSGEHLLGSVQETPYQTLSGTDTAMPSRQPITFSYTGARRNFYIDGTVIVNGSNYSGQTWWQYLTGFSDQQTGAGATIQYQEADGNTNGVPAGSNVQDPFTCDAVNCGGTQYDRQWSRQSVSTITDTGTGAKTTYSYRLNNPCGSCNGNFTWIGTKGWNACNGNPQAPASPMPACLTTDWQNYYDAEYTGYLQVYATHPDGSTGYAQYFAGGGWGTNDWDTDNIARGLVQISDDYQGAAGGTPLDEVWHTYSNNTSCPSGVYNNGQLYINPYIFCILVENQRDTYVGGGKSSSAPHLTQTWSYDPYYWYGWLDSTATTTNDLLSDSSTSYGSTQPTFTTKFGYAGRDGANESPQTPFYFEDLVASSVLDDNLGNRWACAQIGYDGIAIGASGTLRAALPTEQTAYGDCGNSANNYTQTGGVTTGTGYDGFGRPIVATDADAVAGVGGHTGCGASASLLVNYSAGLSSYSTCVAYETTTNAYPSASNNALFAEGTTTWDVLQGVPTASTDANGVQTTYAGPIYEYSGSPSLSTYQDTYAQTTLPGESYGGSAPWTTRIFSFSFCAGATSGGTAPCVETDTVRQLDGTNLAVSRQFYDRDGRLAETRTIGPTVGQDTVRYTTYDATNAKVFQSLSCSVAALSTSNGGRSVGSTPGYVAPTQATSGSSAYVDPNVSGTNCYKQTLTGTTTYYDALGRVSASDDPMGTGAGTSGSGCLLPTASTHHTTCAAYTAVVASATSGLPSTDNQPYLQTVSIDANLHQSASYSDALGHTAYSQRLGGASQSPFGSGTSSYSVASSKYDGADNLVSITDPQGHTTTFGYDKLGRQASLADPDRGNETYSYDADGNVTETVDARGASGTIYAGYDGLDRQVWRNSSNSPTGAYVSYSYDSTASGNDGKGRLTGESFSATGGTGLGSGSYSYVYDSRGRTTSMTLSLNGSSYPVAASYTDFDALASQTYPTGEVLATSYSAAGAPLALTRTPSGGGATTLWDNPVYSTAAATAGLLTSARLGQTYTVASSEDGDLRTNDRKYTLVSSGATLFEEAIGYDNIGNVTSTTATLPAGTVASQFCYDEQDRLTWAGTSGTPPCTGSAITGTSITSAQYTITYGYDTLDRLTSGGSGSYTYGDPAHLHAATAIGTNYSASYDAAGNMTCRGTSSLTSTCSATPVTGAQLGNDSEGRLVTWQNLPTAPTSSATYLYDGEGRRVESQVTGAGVTTTTVYVGNLEEVASSPTGTTTTTYAYGPDGERIALAVNGTLAYQASDHLGSAAVTLDGSGNLTGSQLYAAYGTSAYSSGSMPGSYGYTGQRSDAATTGLDYYGARYYDPVAAQFTSADAVRDGQSPFGYVAGNPETYTDPSGHESIEEMETGGQLGAPSSGADLLGGDAVGTPGTAGSDGADWSPSGPPVTITEPDGTTYEVVDNTVTITNPDGSRIITDASEVDFGGETGDWQNQGTMLQQAAEEGSHGNGPQGNAPQPVAQPSVTEPTQPTSRGSNQVILDTNAVYEFNQPGVQAQIASDETPVITETTWAELQNNAVNGPESGDGERMPIPRVAGTLDVVPDEYNPDIARDIRARMRSDKYGVNGDVIIGTTAATTDRPLITGDQELYNTMIRLFGPGAARLTH